MRGGRKGLSCALRAFCFLRGHCASFASPALSLFRWHLPAERYYCSHAMTIAIDKPMPLLSHPGRFLKRELEARGLSANQIALDLGVPSGRITDILNGRRAITADTAVRLGRYFGNGAQFWLDLQSQYEIGVVERDRGADIARRVHPLDAAE